jgi:serine phosphatase RsbU (regulator of sigma subunit)
MMQKRPTKILLVECNSTESQTIRHFLDNHSNTSFEVVHVELLSAALECCSSERFDAILLDSELPDSNGMTTFLAMFAEATSPIILLARRTDEALAMQCVASGAQNYLLQDEISEENLTTTVRQAVERRHSCQASVRRRNPSNTATPHASVQHGLSPNDLPELRNFDIAGAVYPAKEAVGDYFDLLKMRDDCLVIILGDGSRQNEHDSLWMPESRICMRTLVQTFNNAGDIFVRCHQMLAMNNRSANIPTLAMAKIDPRTRSLVFAGVGQRGYVLHTGVNATILECTKACWNDVTDRETVATAPMLLHPGDLFTFFTDGMIHAESPSRMPFGVARTLQTIRSEREQSSHAILEALHKEIQVFCRGESLKDDIAVVVVKVL